MDDEVVERFRPTSGVVGGTLGVLLTAFFAVFVLVDSRSEVSVRVALLLVSGTAVVWATQIRPRARAYADRLVLVNVLRDTSIPLRDVEEVAVQQTLVVFTEEDRYIGVGIGRTMRGIFRGERQAGGGLLGSGKLLEYTDKRDVRLGDRSSMAYQDFVAQRIYQLSDDARTHRLGEGLRVEHRWAWLPILAIALPLVAEVVTFVL